MLVALPARALDIEQWQTEQGLRVLFVPAPALPMLDIRLTFDAGSARDGARPGLANLTSEALRHGTATLDASALAERFESVGAQFDVSSARDMGVVTLRTLTEPDWFETALATLTELLAAPRFPEEDLARSRRQALLALQRERQEPGTLAARRFYQLVYGDHPYASHPLGTEDSLPNLTREQALDFYRTFYSAGNGVLAMTGGIDRDRARRIADRIAAALPAGPRAPALPAVKPLAAPVEERLPFPSEQAHIYMGAPGLARGDPDYYALILGNHVLGGGSFTSRLFKEVRERRGLAYSIHSHYQPMAAAGPFMVVMQTAVAQTDDALALLRAELARYRRDGVTPDELALARDNLVGSFPLGLASNGDIAQNLGMIGFYGLPLDYLDTWPSRIAALAADEVGATVARRLDPARLVTIVVGGPDQGTVQ